MLLAVLLVIVNDAPLFLMPLSRDYYLIKHGHGWRLKSKIFHNVRNLGFPEKRYLMIKAIDKKKKELIHELHMPLVWIELQENRVLVHVIILNIVYT